MWHIGKIHCAENQRSFLSQPKNTAVKLENFKLEISEASQYHKLPLISPGFIQFTSSMGVLGELINRGAYPYVEPNGLIHCKWNSKSTSKQAMEVLVKIDVRFAFTGF